MSGYQRGAPSPGGREKPFISVQRIKTFGEGTEKITQLLALTAEQAEMILEDLAALQGRNVAIRVTTEQRSRNDGRGTFPSAYVTVNEDTYEGGKAVPQKKATFKPKVYGNGVGGNTTSHAKPAVKTGYSKPYVKQQTELVDEGEE